MKTLFAFALVSFGLSIAQAAIPGSGPNEGVLHSETVYNCTDISGHVEVRIADQQGSWTEGSGDQTSYIFHRVVTSVKVDGKEATMLSAACRGAWRARAALCSAQVGDVRYDLFRGINFPLKISAVVWVGNRSSSLPILCRQTESPSGK